MLILEGLYLSDVLSSERSIKRNRQYARALEKVIKAGGALTDGLTESKNAVRRLHNYSA